MTALAVALLLAGVAGALWRPFGIPAWLAPVVAAAVGALAGTTGLGASVTALRVLLAPIAFLLAAVPLSVLLDELGFFRAAARLLAGRSGSLGGLWLLAAGVTTVLNLDAAVVLLTPLYIRIARSRDLDPLALALQPLVLAWLASSALPVSNLTNLIAASDTGASATSFLVHLGPPSLAAVLVGWWAYRAAFHPGLRQCRSGPAGPAAPPSALPARGATAGSGGPAGSTLSPEPCASAPAPGSTGPTDRRALGTGGAVVAVVLVGFVVGRYAGISAWEVALGADALLLVRRGFRAPPWGAAPVGTAAVAASLGVLATAVVAHLPIGRWLGGGVGLLGLARVAGLSALAANLINNLPALLVLLPSLGRRRPELWAALVGVNMGPVLLVTGTLASLLWVDTVRRMGVAVRAADVSRAGLRVGLPGAAAGLAVLLAMRAAGIGT
ncbi:MAG: citrate transporter [Actinomycetota bacterium]|nr:citrate transporter [Actinomycetota bacterium]